MARVAHLSIIVIQFLSPPPMKRVLAALKRIMIFFCQIAKHDNLQSSVVSVQYQSLLDLTVDFNN